MLKFTVEMPFSFFFFCHHPPPVWLGSVFSCPSQVCLSVCLSCLSHAYHAMPLQKARKSHMGMACSAAGGKGACLPVSCITLNQSLPCLSTCLHATHVCLCPVCPPTCSLVRMWCAVVRLQAKAKQTQQALVEGPAVYAGRKALALRVSAVCAKMPFRVMLQIACCAQKGGAGIYRFACYAARSVAAAPFLVSGAKRRPTSNARNACAAAACWRSPCKI